MYALFVCTLHVRFLLSPFPIVSVAVWIKTMGHCMELNYFVFETFLSAAFLASVNRLQGPFDLCTLSHLYTLSHLCTLLQFPIVVIVQSVLINLKKIQNRNFSHFLYKPKLT